MSAEQVRTRLNELLAGAGFAPLDSHTAERFERYLLLYLRWNARLNLSAIGDEEGILSRHFVESIACARALPLQISTLLDYGSGAGLPGVPIALCRPEIFVTLAESQRKKAAFLCEAVRTLGLKAAVHSGRAELLAGPFDCIALRAVNRMAEAVRSAARLVAVNGWLALMTTQSDLAALQTAAGAEFSWQEAIRLPRSKERILACGARTTNQL
jgi:16S rRNA (guanine527-N7)-methyltransferase